MSYAPVCRVCASRLEAEFAFCPTCGARVAPDPRPAQIERRVLAILFCDLVGFSSMAATLDAEDVEELLGRYLRAVKACVHDHGGVIEKYIGDAMVAVFGYDEAHGDDVDRALDCALAICAAVENLQGPGGSPLQVHLGVHVGEVIVDVRADPTSGASYMAGHVVNLAQRLQALAPAGATVVSREVVDAVGSSFTFAEQPSSVVKGHPTPLEVYALIGRSRVHELDVLPLVGREEELTYLVGLIDEVASARTSVSVVISGEAGVGKSRLLLELELLAGARPFRVRWYKGRCLPYGTGVTFSALAQLLKQATGVLETDDQDVVVRRVTAALSAAPDRDRLAAGLLPLLGVPGHEVDREELFGAWAEALHVLSDATPTVLVIEDLHWADAGLLAFVEWLAALELPSPLLIVLTTRPSLLEAEPSWPSPTVRSVALTGLSTADTERVVLAELGSADLALAAPVRLALLERADGNPLFAREFARLVRDASRLGAGDPVELTELPVPTSIHALLAARLDTLSLYERAVLQCAAVIGKVFWSGAVTALGDLAVDEVMPALDALCRHGLLRRSRSSVLAGQDEYSFSHVLLRDVAYDRSPRSWRQAAHLRAVDWIESVAGPRLDEVAEVVVHHALAAGELARLTHDTAGEQRAGEAAKRYALVAGRRAMALDVGRAQAMFDIAVELTRPGDPDEAEILLAWSIAAFARGRVAEATQVRERVVALLRASDDVPLLITALNDLGDGYYQLGNLSAALAADREAAQWGRRPGGERATNDPVANLALTLAAIGDLEGLAVADEAEARARQRGAETPITAVRARAILRLQLGDPTGLADHREAVARMMHEGHPGGSIANTMCYLADGVWSVLGPEAAVPAYSEAIDFASSRGLTNVARWARVNRLGPLFEAGEVQRVNDEAEASWPDLADSRIGIEVLAMLIAAPYERGRTDAVLGHAPDVDAALAEALAEQPEDPEKLCFLMMAGLRVAHLTGDVERCRLVLEQLRHRPAVRAASSYGHHLTSYVRAALAWSTLECAQELASTERPDSTLRGLAQQTAGAWLALVEQPGQASDRFVGLAASWADVGHRLEHSYCLLGRAIGTGDPAHFDQAAQSRQALGLPGAAPLSAELTDRLGCNRAASR